MRWIPTTAAASLAALALYGCAADSDFDSDPPQEPARSAIINGSPVSLMDGPGWSGVQLRFGTSPECSATLLTDHWVLTATHCLPLDAAQSDPPEFDPVAHQLTLANIGSGQVISAGAVAGATSQNVPMRIVRHPLIFNLWPQADAADAVLIHVDAPFGVGFGGPPRILDYSPFALGGKDVRVQGYGYNWSCDSASDSGSGNGALDFGDFKVDAVSNWSSTHERRFLISANALKQLPAGGDDGAGVWYHDPVHHDWALAGILSGGSCHYTSGQAGPPTGSGNIVTHDSFRTWAIATMLGGWGREIGWCQQPYQQLMVADFNGDGRDDLLCHDPKSGKQYLDFARMKPDGSAAVAGFTGTGVNGHPDPGLFGPTDSSGPLGHFCKETTGSLLVGDFNADGRADLLCHGTTGKHWIAYGSFSGSIDYSLWSDLVHPFCATGELHVGDFNGDGRDDLLCHDGVIGKQQIAYSNISGQPNFTHAIEGPVSGSFCKNATGKLYLGKFNGDNRSDLLCDGVMGDGAWMVYSGANNRPNYASLTSIPAGLCGHVFDVKIADLDGDSRSDVICFAHDVGDPFIFYTNANGLPDWDSLYAPHLNWCSQAADRLLVGNFNGDAHADLLCHSGGDQGAPLNGSQYVIYTGADGRFHFQ